MDLSADHILEEGYELGLMGQVRPSPPFQGTGWFPSLSPTKGIGISPGFPQSCLSVMLQGAGDCSAVWLQDLGDLVCGFAGLGEPLVPTGAAVSQSEIQLVFQQPHSPAPPEHSLCFHKSCWDPQGFSSILTPVLLSPPSRVFGCCKPRDEISR